MFKLVFAALLLTIAFSVTYTESLAAFSGFDLWAIIGLGAVINAALLLGPLFLLRPGAVANAILALVVAVGVFTLYLVHTDLFFPSNRAALIAVSGAACFTLVVAFRVMDELRWGGAALSGAALLAVAVIVGRSVSADASGSPADVDLSNIRPVEFRETPNLYFISFDGIAPLALLEQRLGIQDTRLHDLFATEFRRFPNFFANAVSTINSINMLLALDEDVFFSIKSGLEAGTASLFAGWQPSPLLGILRENGYETSSLYSDAYLGYPKGPHVDHLLINGAQEAVCPLLAAEVRIWAFYGYCRIIRPHSRPVTIDAGDFLVEQATGLDRSRPQFLIAHLNVPGHTESYFRYDDRDHVDEFRDHYIQGTNEAAGYLRDIVDHLKRNDPDAILFVYGDHGPYLSQGMRFEERPGFFVQDRFAILGGVYPRTRCAAYFDTALGKGHLTILDGVHAILGCLSGGQSALVRPRENRLGGTGGVPRDSGYDYGDFRYEEGGYEYEAHAAQVPGRRHG